MELLLARTNAEAHLYLDLHPCVCGDRSRPTETAVLEIQGDLVSRYRGTCPSCETDREFLFRLPEDIVMPRPGAVVFGDGTPSELLDPGEWLWVADRYARTAPWDPSQVERDKLPQIRRNVAVAEAAMDEILAFIPPGTDAVPPQAFRSERGRSVYAAEPGRFSRDRLTVVRDTYREMLDELDAALAG